MNERKGYIKIGQLIYRVEWAHISPNNKYGTALLSGDNGRQMFIDVDVEDAEKWRKYLDE